MGCDTNGFLATKEKNPFKVWATIKKSLIDDMLEQSGADNQMRLFWMDKENYICPSAEIRDFAEMLTIGFKYKGENRSMNVHLDCDRDYDDVYKGKKIIVSLGAWGSSVHLIEVVLKALQSEFGGRAWMRNNDCSDDWRKIK